MTEPQAMTFGPSVHTFRFRNPDEWDIPFTNWTILRATDADGREHLFEVPTEALSTVTPPAAGELVVAWKRADGNDLLPAGWTVVAGDAALRAEHPPTVEDAARKAEVPSPSDLVSALAYAFARTDVPGKMETGRAYAERLVPLMEESGYLSTPAARPEAPEKGETHGAHCFASPETCPDPPAHCMCGNWGDHVPNVDCTPAARPAEVLDAAWADLRAEVEVFEAWYLPTRMGVNAWVGVDTASPDGFYGGWAVEGDPLEDDWDESEMTTASGDSPEAVVADLIRIGRDYRQRRDEEHAEYEADNAEIAARLGADRTEEPRE